MTRMRHSLKYLVLHYSHNWCWDGQVTLQFKTLKEAKKYVDDFRGSAAHRLDIYSIVRVVERGEAVKLRPSEWGLKEKI